jgi:uncharacterized glyoxalase superfamily protein PhnB
MSALPTSRRIKEWLSISTPLHSLNVGTAHGTAEPTSAGRIVVGFSVSTRAEVDAVFRDMSGAGYRGLQEPHDAFWGARYAIIEDPDGIAVGMMSPVSVDKKSPSPNV